MESKPVREPIPQKVEEAASIVVDSALCVHRELGPGCWRAHTRLVW